MDKIIIVDFGSQYTQLIARKTRELNVYSEIYPYHSLPEPDNQVKGIILSGSPYSVREENPPMIDIVRYASGLPVLGLCYGAQLMVHQFKGEVGQSKIREYGRAKLEITDFSSPLFQNLENHSQVWMSHSDTVFRLPQNFTVTGKTENIPVAAFQSLDKKLFALQFHPEVHHTFQGKMILQNFLQNICGCSREWTPAHFVSSTVENLTKELKDDKVVFGLSGGVDSTVAAILMNKAIAANLYCIFVDNGLLRKNEFTDVLKAYRDLGLNILAVDAKNEFYQALHGISDPELKRKAIGRTFIEVFEREAKKIKGATWLGQGTIYPDVIESAGTKGPAATIKSHHNVGGLPEKMHLKIVEPLRMLFKDEVRLVAKELGIPEKIYSRHPFPGPGLAVRILGEITMEKIQILQDADYIFINELRDKELYNKIWQAATILLPVKSVGVMGDERTYEYTAVLRAVTSTDGMTADWYPLPHDFLAEVSNKIINQVKGINRVVYDISSKPPATIEWE